MDFNKLKDVAIKGLGYGGSVSAGVILAVLLVRQFGDKAPAWAKSLLAVIPGLAMTLSSNKYLLSTGLAMTGTGMLIAAKQFTDGKDGILKTINDYIPGLAGLNDNVQYYMPQQTDNALLSGINGLGQLPDNMLLS